jgi:hypothetical protein
VQQRQRHGRNHKEITKEFWSEEALFGIILIMFEAIEALHGDLKPDNLYLTEHNG